MLYIYNAEVRTVCRLCLWIHSSMVTCHISCSSYRAVTKFAGNDAFWVCSVICEDTDRKPDYTAMFRNLKVISAPRLRKLGFSFPLTLLIFTCQPVNQPIKWKFYPARILQNKVTLQALQPYNQVSYYSVLVRWNNRSFQARFDTVSIFKTREKKMLEKNTSTYDMHCNMTEGGVNWWQTDVNGLEQAAVKAVHVMWSPVSSVCPRDAVMKIYFSLQSV